MIHSVIIYGRGEASRVAGRFNTLDIAHDLADALRVEGYKVMIKSEPKEWREVHS